MVVEPVNQFFATSMNCIRVQSIYWHRARILNIQAFIYMNFFLYILHMIYESKKTEVLYVTEVNLILFLKRWLLFTYKLWFIFLINWVSPQYWVPLFVSVERICPTCLSNVTFTISYLLYLIRQFAEWETYLYDRKGLFKYLDLHIAFTHYDYFQNPKYKTVNVSVTVVNVKWTDIGQTRVTFTKFQYKYSHQSGTKLNLVAKFWLPTLVSSLWYL